MTRTEAGEMAPRLRVPTGRGPGSESQHPHGGSELYVTPVPGDVMSSFGFSKHQACMWCASKHLYT